MKKKKLIISAFFLFITFSANIAMAQTYNVRASSSGFTEGYITKWSPYSGGYDRISNSAIFQDSNNNIGIGTTSPSVKLEINGQIKVTGGTPGDGKILTSDANGLSSWQTLVTSGTAWQLTGNSGTNPGTNFIGTIDAKDLVFKTNTTEWMRILSGGNVGIGTTSPAAKLEVAGNVKISSLASSSGTNIVQVGTDGILTPISSVYAGIGLWQQSGTDIYNENTGYVGIGTNQPTAKLEINGQVKVTGGTPGDGKILTSDANGLANWRTPVTSGTAWQLNGNTGTGNFIGTTDAQDLVFRTNNSERMKILSDGNAYFNDNVGIGTSPTTNRLEVGGTIKASGFLTIDGADFRLGCNDNRTNNGAPDNRAMVHAGGLNGKDDLYINYAGDFTDGVIIDGPKTIIIGNVGIGTSSPDAKLTVNGKIKAEEIEVIVDVLPDYVFEKDYSLMNLNELKEFINKNKHLPEIPSAEYVKENGMNVGEMNALLLKKIEELTLYMLDLKKNNDILLEEINKIKSQNRNK